MFCLLLIFLIFFPLFLDLMQLMARRPIPVLREQGFLSSYRHSDRFFSLQTISSQSVAVAEQTVSSQRVAVAEQAVSSQCVAVAKQAVSSQRVAEQTVSSKCVAVAE